MIIIAIITLLLLIIIVGLAWYIFKLKANIKQTISEHDDLKLEILDLEDNIRELTTSNLGLLANITQLQADNTELITKNSELIASMTEQQSKYDMQENILELNIKRLNLQLSDEKLDKYNLKALFLQEKTNKLHNNEDSHHEYLKMKKKLIVKESELNLFKNNYSKDKRKLELILNLKQEIKFQRRMIQNIKTTHTEYQNSPNEHFRKQIEDLIDQLYILENSNQHLKVENHQMKLDKYSFKHILLSNEKENEILRDIRLKERERYSTKISKLKGELSLWDSRQQANNIRYINIPDELHQLMDQIHLLVQQLSDEKLDKYNLKALLLEKLQNILNNNENREKNNFGIKQELIRKDKELKLLKQIYCKENGRLILDIRNLKEEMEFNIERFHASKTMHIEYQNTPDEFLWKKIGDLHEQKNILEISNNKLQLEINMLKEDNFNIKSHILQEKRDMNREWPKGHSNNIYIKRRLESFHQEYRSFAHYMNIKTTELRNSNNNLKQEILTNNRKLQTLKTLHIEYKNVPDELLRKEIVDFRDINIIFQNDIKELSTELSELKIDKFNLKSEILDTKKFTNMKFRYFDNSNELFLKNKLIHIHEENNNCFMKYYLSRIDREIKMITKNGEIDYRWNVNSTRRDAVAIKAKKAITLTGFGVYAEKVSYTKSTLNEIPYHFQILQPSGEIIRDWISRKTPKSQYELILEEKFEQEDYIHMKLGDIVYIYQYVEKVTQLHATDSLKQVIFEDLEFIENPNTDNGRRELNNRKITTQFPQIYYY